MFADPLLGYFMVELRYSDDVQEILEPSFQSCCKAQVVWLWLMLFCLWLQSIIILIFLNFKLLPKCCSESVFVLGRLSLSQFNVISLLLLTRLICHVHHSSHHSLRI